MEKAGSFVDIPCYVKENTQYGSDKVFPDVSVIIPVYNVAPFLRECLDSVIDQTLRNIEIICVNDGSTDDSLSILEEYYRKDPRVTVISQRNRGLSGTRNHGMEYAHGNYIYFLDSDDYIDLDTLEISVKVAVEKDLDVVAFGFTRFGDEDLEMSIFGSHTYSFGHLDICTGVQYIKEKRDNNNFVQTAWQAIWRRSFLNEYGIKFEEGILHEDNLFTFSVFMDAKRVIQLPNEFYHRRVHGESIMAAPSSAKNVYGYFKSAEGVLEYALNGNFDALKEHEIWRSFRTLINTAESIYNKLSDDEKRKVVFLNEMENELFNRLIINCLKNKELIAAGEKLKKENKKLKEANKKLKAVEKNEEDLRQEIKSLKESLSFRIGRSITFIPRKIRGGVRCYKEHGVRYTWERVLVHLHLKQEPESENKAEHSVSVEKMQVQPVKKDYNYYSSLDPADYARELKIWYKQKMKQELDLDSPKTFNEKIQWMKLYDSTPMKTRLADKYLVREWVTEIIGEEYLVPLLGVWDSFDEIDFDKLPDQFVLKANHGSGWNIIVKDKAQFDREEAKKKFDKWLNTNFAFAYGLELHYLNIPPKIIAEQYLENIGGIKDYRFYCFNGKPVQVWVDIFSGTPGHLRSVFDMDWNPIPLKCTWPEGGDLLSEKPQSFEKMKEFAGLLSKDFAFVRVDFFDVEGRLYMGEMTFTPMSGTGKFEPIEWDAVLGDCLVLPPKSPIPKRLG